MFDSIVGEFPDSNPFRSGPGCMQQKKKKNEIQSKKMSRITKVELLENESLRDRFRMMTNIDCLRTIAFFYYYYFKLKNGE